MDPTKETRTHESDECQDCVDAAALKVVKHPDWPAAVTAKVLADDSTCLMMHNGIVDHVLTEIFNDLDIPVGGTSWAVAQQVLAIKASEHEGDFHTSWIRGLSALVVDLGAEVHTARQSK